MQTNFSNYQNSQNFGMAIRISDSATKTELMHHLSKKGRAELEKLIKQEAENPNIVSIYKKTYDKNNIPYWTGGSITHNWDFAIKAGDKEFVDNNMFVSTLGQIRRAIKYSHKNNA